MELHYMVRGKKVTDLWQRSMWFRLNDDVMCTLEACWVKKWECQLLCSVSAWF